MAPAALKAPIRPRGMGGSMERWPRGGPREVTGLALASNSCSITNQLCDPERGFPPQPVSPSRNGWGWEHFPTERSEHEA